MTDKRDELLREHTDLLLNNENLNVIPIDDPDLLRMEEIMEEIKKLEESEEM